MMSMGLTLVAEQARIRGERAVLAIRLRTLVRLQVRVQVFTGIVLARGLAMDWASNLLKDALLLRRFVVAVLDGIEERAAIPAVGAWARIVVWITPGLLVLVAMFTVSSGFALVGIFAGAILPI